MFDLWMKAFQAARQSPFCNRFCYSIMYRTLPRVLCRRLMFFPFGVPVNAGFV